MIYLFILLTLALNYFAYDRYVYANKQRGTGGLSDAVVFIFIAFISLLVDISWLIWAFI